MISCRVCGIEDWINCDCYYRHGGASGLGDMNVEFNLEMVGE